jgi:hypothetical protein
MQLSLTLLLIGTHGAVFFCNVRIDIAQRTAVRARRVVSSASAGSGSAESAGSAGQGQGPRKTLLVPLLPARLLIVVWSQVARSASDQRFQRAQQAPVLQRK